MQSIFRYSGLEIVTLNCRGATQNYFQNLIQGFINKILAGNLLRIPGPILVRQVPIVRWNLKKAEIKGSKDPLMEQSLV